MDDSISISEPELKTVIDNLSSESTEISKSLEDISKLFDSFEFEGEIGDSIRTKFTAIEDTFSVVKTNVESYKANNKAVTVGVSIGLAAIFSGLLYWIFKKEEK